MLPNNSPRKGASFFDESLKLVSYCPLCEKNYNILEARVLEEKDSTSLIYLRCRHCGSSILALVMHHPLGISSVGLVTDLSPEEVLKYRIEADFTEDNVLEMHQLLQKTGSVIELLS
ncbi:MAG: hypothetical protein WCT37_01705 [Patescibacteria group bacterium]|jgi:hypothetical protein